MDSRLDFLRTHVEVTLLLRFFSFSVNGPQMTSFFFVNFNAQIACMDTLVTTSVTLVLGFFSFQ